LWACAEVGCSKLSSGSILARSMKHP
jgi:hypothetical protein